MSKKVKNITLVCAPNDGWYIVNGSEGLKILLDVISKSWQENRCCKIEADGVLFVPDSFKRRLIPSGDNIATEEV